MSDKRIELTRMPRGWCEVEIREILEIIDYRGRTPPYSEDGIPHLRSSNIRNGRIIWEDLRYVSRETYDFYMTRGFPNKDDVLFTTEAPLGEVALAPNQKFSLAQRMMILKPPRNVILPKFLMYQIQSGNFQRKIGNVGTGTTVSGISSRNFKPIPLLIATFAEQQRIVDKIEELFSDLDSGIASLKTAQQQLKVYRQAVLKWAFEGKLTDQWREEQQRQGKLESADTLLAQIKAEREQRYQKELEVWQAEVEAWDAIGKEGKKPRKPIQIGFTEPLNQTEIDLLWPIPGNWQWRKLGELFRVYVGATPSRKRIDYWDGDIPWVSSGEVGFCRIKKTEETITLEGLLNTSTEKHPPGTIMLGMIGEGKTRGQSAILDIDAAHNQNTAAIRVSETECVPALLFYYFYFQYQKTREIGSGNNQKALNKSRVEGIAYPLIPVEEQYEILAEVESKLSICDQLEADIETNLKKAEALRQSILKQAFEGKLVPQDPNDEPASVLLERIRAEREAEKGNGKAKATTKTKTKAAAV